MNRASSLRERTAVSAGPSDLRALIEKVLVALADLMIDADLSMGELEEIAKRAYTDAAATRATRANGTVNRSRIAAITGLSRAEVTQLLTGRVRAVPRNKRSRARKILDGWRSDMRFRNARGPLRTIPIQGEQGSFEQLVRLYGGDVTPKAMLDRLQRLNLVKIVPATGGRATQVRRLGRTEPPAIDKSLCSLVGLLADCLATRATPIAPSVTRIQIPAADPVELAIYKRAVSERADVFLSGLRSSFPSRAAADLQVNVVIGITTKRNADSNGKGQPRTRYRLAKRT